MIYSGARILIEELIRHDIKTVFGYPGGAVLDIYDELYNNCDRIEHIISAHEQGAAHAADGYARVTGKPAVVIATSGPGATNLVTGIANAYLDSVPIIAVTGNVAVPLLGRDSFQEVDIVGITQPIVKHSYIVREADELEFIINEAFAIASSGRKGPVLIDISKTAQSGTCEYKGNYNISFNEKKPLPDLSVALKAIETAKKPYIYCGGGVLASNAEKEVLELSKRISAPIGLSIMGLTAVPSSYELNLGVSGMHGKYASNLAQSEADLMIAVGVRFSDRATGNLSEYTKNCTVIHIDIDEAELGKNVASMIDLCGDAKLILQSLLSSIKKSEKPNWVNRVLCYKKSDNQISDKKDFLPENIISFIRTKMSSDTVVATDVGQHQMWVVQHYGFEKPHKLLTSGGLGTMGYGMGAAVGGCVASDRKRTVLFTGDGSFGMNLNEIATAVSQGLPLLIVILNNGVLGMVRQWQCMFYDERYSSTTLNRRTSFVDLAKAFGADGKVVNSMSKLESVFEDGLPDNKPLILDCRIDLDKKVFPMIPPQGSVKDILIG